jgi:uncharacterized protein
VYRFFRDELGAQFIQFIPIVEHVSQAATQKGPTSAKRGSPVFPEEQMVTERSVKPEQYGRFLSTIFDEWVRRDVGRVFVQIFDVALANWVGEQPGLCTFSETCGLALVLEHNGDLYSCDHYVTPDHLLGNIQETHMGRLVASDHQRRFGLDKRDTLPSCCRQCQVRFTCHGGCPRNRFVQTPDGEPGLNYLCPGYKLFFDHIDTPMRVMATLLRQDKAPAEVMSAFDG